MTPGRESQTAVLVCMGRAFAHGRSDARFSDPTALALLPEPARQSVEQFRSSGAPREWRARFRYEHLTRESLLMVARTIAIDDAVRAAAAPQLVILGAGLDGRAWRMPELQGTLVFEIDHPDSQRDKRERARSLTSLAREVRFVPVDFERDDLATALAAAGHDAARPTTWIWEGVVMYLERSAIEASLRVIQARSAAGSRLIIAYHRPALILLLVSVLVRRLGEPIRTALTPEQMRELLGRHGFLVTLDEDLATIGARFSPDVARGTKIMKHMRVVTAERLLS